MNREQTTLGRIKNHLYTSLQDTCNLLINFPSVLQFCHLSKYQTMIKITKLLQKVLKCSINNKLQRLYKLDQEISLSKSLLVGTI